jgi:predicted ABC-type exoprotein transport system permease subunit
VYLRARITYQVYLCADHMVLVITAWVFFKIGVFSYCALLRHRTLTKVTRISITLKTYSVEPMACKGVYQVLCIGMV